MTAVETQWTPDLARSVLLRPDTSDRQVWADTFTGRYHLPPAEMPAPATVLDLGANVGLTAAHYKTLWPQAQVVGVELDDECVELARENAPGVLFHRYAVSGRGGWGTYRPAGLAEAYAFAPGGGSLSSADVPEGERVVSSFTLRQVILRSFVPGRVDFVKMDVEGEEWAILEEGGWEPLVGHLVVELHGEGGSDALVARALEALSALGFAARHHPPHPQAVYAWRLA